MESSESVVWHNATVSRSRRESLNGHKRVILWLIDPSGARVLTAEHSPLESLLQV